VELCRDPGDGKVSKQKIIYLRDSGDRVDKQSYSLNGSEPSGKSTIQVADQKITRYNWVNSSQTLPE
jgi:hypothetical protein